jgi:hypothetical protein
VAAEVRHTESSARTSTPRCTSVDKQPGHQVAHDRQRLGFGPASQGHEPEPGSDVQRRHHPQFDQAASSALREQEVLRALEAERAAEADRLAQHRLQTELATVDHDLVLNALRLALTVRVHDAARAQALLADVTAYLRLAQQRGSSEPGRIAAVLAELRQACASQGAVPVEKVTA